MCQALQHLHLRRITGAVQVSEQPRGLFGRPTGLLRNAWPVSAISPLIEKTQKSLVSGAKEQAHARDF